MAASRKNESKPNGHAATHHRSTPAPSNVLSFAKPASELSERSIAEAAYFLWQQRGGDQLANWLEAEAKLRKTLKRSA